VKREITLDEFKKLKEHEPFETMRQSAKGCNFGLIYGMQGVTFARTTLRPTWTDEQVKSFLRDNDLLDKVDSIYARMRGEMPREDCMYVAAADYIRSKFFKTYPGIEARTKRYKEFAEQNGYIRSYHGAIRRLPILMYQGGDDERSEVSGCNNVAVNTSIQNDEACRVMPSIECFERWLRENKMKSYTYGTVHDSADICIHRDEIHEVLKKIHEIFERYEEWQNGVQLTIDIKIADLRKEEFYKGGLKEKAFLKRLEGERSDS
jgi:DNA polymerase I-like protein with 3'-5' exonuclease and polymerase domains